MEFKEFNDKIQQQFAKMCQTGQLFRADVSGNDLWDTYLSSFEDEKTFRDPESSEHNCNCCKNFIRRYGNVVSINSDGTLESIFSDIGNVGDYTASVKSVNDLVVSKNIKNVFFETYNELNSNLNYESCDKNQDVYKLGIESNFKKYTQEEADKFGVVNTKDVYEFHHFFIELPKQFVDFSGKSIESIMAFYRDKYSVFKRAMEEIPLDTLNLVKDLINQGSLLDGTSHLHSVEQFIQIWEKPIPINMNKDLWYWNVSYNIEERVAKFKNTLIGVLCTELAEGEELNKACLNWNKRVDPANYHKATAPITQKQIKEAQKFVEENGYTESFDRRLATIDDIKASEILHLNSGDGKIKEISIFDNVKATFTQHKRSQFDNIEVVSIDKFMSDILPNCSSVEAYLENRMQGNLVILTTSNQEDSKPIFKWSNNYSWTFNGNLAGKSQLKQAVSSQGGKVDGALRFSIMWAEGDGDNSDLDAHCVEPNGNRIYFSNKTSVKTKGWLDIDITAPKNHNKEVVENISYPELNSMPDGKYEFMVHQYSARNSKGFKAEIEFNGESYSYEYKNPLRGSEYIPVATVTKRGSEFIINHALPETNSSKELWELETNNFHKVNLVCLSPNHWGESKAGNKHYMFMLDNCKSDTSIRGFHNENLSEDLLKHRKVMEVLGTTSMIESIDKQLSGVGFNSTVKDELIVKCSGSFKRTLKIKF